MEDNTSKIDAVHSIPVRAGKPTYFFDIKTTPSDDYYLTITESKRQFLDEGNINYKRHKIFVFKEDLENFKNSLNDAVSYIFENRGKDVIIKEEKLNEE